MKPSRGTIGGDFDPMAPPAIDPGTSRPEKTARPRIPWHVVYYLLAAFDVLTVSASLYLSSRLLGIYRDSVSQNQEWARHLDEYAALQQLAADANAPGNDLFESHDVARESERLARARAAFADQLVVLRRHLVEVHPGEARSMLTRFEAVERAMAEMTAEAQTTFSAFAAGGATPAGRRMAAMDRRYANVLDRAARAATRRARRPAAAVRRAGGRGAEAPGVRGGDRGPDRPHGGSRHRVRSPDRPGDGRGVDRAGALPRWSWSNGWKPGRAPCASRKRR